jgi:hypothetical protein
MQISGRRQKSAIDSAIILLHKIQRNKLTKEITSVLFMDIKGAFDHVSLSQLLYTNQKLGLPYVLWKCINSFIANCKIQLKFDGKTAVKTAISTRIPQGSAVSPIIFFLYTRNLFIEIDRRNTIIPSYINDIAIITRSKSITINNAILKKKAENLIEKRKNQNIKFDIAKIELIRLNKQKRDLPGDLTITINGEIVTIPAKKVLNGSVSGSIEN